MTHDYHTVKRHADRAAFQCYPQRVIDTRVDDLRNRCIDYPTALRTVVTDQNPVIRRIDRDELEVIVCVLVEHESGTALCVDLARERQERLRVEMRNRPPH